MTQVREQEQQVLATVNHLLDGFKELRVNDRKSDDFFQRGLKPHLARLKALKLQMRQYFIASYTLVCVLWETLIIALAVLLPLVGHFQVPLSITVVGLVLFFLPTSALIEHVPRLMIASLSLQRLLRFQQQLDALPPEPVADDSATPPAFQELRDEDISFRYAAGDAQPFAIGPLSLTFRAGEIVFLTGGNGSGKTTLLKVLTGLYPIAGGQIYLNGVPVAAAPQRELFAPIFSDFHLFDRLYGLPALDAAPVNDLLKRLELDAVVQFAAQQFSTLAVSAGQQKRLALAAALLEAKPIYVFDEWAADQDPHFRQYFYAEVLPALKAQGKTVLAVTHDDRYFASADRVVRMEEGAFAA